MSLNNLFEKLSFNNLVSTRETDWKSVTWGFCKSDPDPERLNNLPRDIALIQMINFNRVVPGHCPQQQLQGVADSS